jgi:peptide/nickel transport system permease protein
MTAPTLQPEGLPPAEPTLVATGHQRGRFARLRRVLTPILAARGLQRWLLFSGLFIVVAFLTLAVFAPLISPYHFDTFEAHGVEFAKYGHPSFHHLFGTSVRQEDVLSRVIFGARTALEVVVLAVMFSLFVGVPLGLIAGYIGGWLDRVLVLIMDALFAFPYLLLAIVIAFLLSDKIGGGIMTAAIAITVVYIPQYFRVVRSSVLSVREEPFIEAARALGAPPRTVITRYLFVNVIQSVPIIATLNAADAILTLAGLDFLGFGIQPTQAAEWGYDLNRAIADTQAGIWWTGLFPGLAIVLLVTGLTLLGEGLNDVLNPVLRRRRGVVPTMPDERPEPPPREELAS